MPRISRQNQALRDFILRNVRSYPGTISARAAQEFGVSRVTVSNYVRRLIDDGLLQAKGNTSDRRYQAVPLLNIRFQIKLSVGLSEDAIWRLRILPRTIDLPQNVIDICQYGFSEIFNNAVDHSASLTADVVFEQTYGYVTIMIIDRGIGIFKKIQRDFTLADPRQALLELSKGRLTSDRKNHSGQGIFFTSRMFDDFTIWSGDLSYRRRRQSEDDWLIEAEDLEKFKAGTIVQMIVGTNAAWAPLDIIQKCQGDVVGFTKTHVPISLGKYPGEQLVSRSQAKRVLARFDRFSEVILDFQGVQEIGPAFADEIFRVYKNSHPDITILAVRTNSQVSRMIQYAESAEDADQPSLLR
jgi:anti-sigma regulatory factor (Ser/Thr protein kinase)